MNLETQFVFHEKNFHDYFHTWTGPVGRSIAARAAFVQAGALASVGFKTGRLRSAITTIFTHTPSGELAARVGVNPLGSRNGYALYHHNGTRPHLIQAKPGSALRFRGAAGAQFARTVQHPGTKPNPYLTRWLREAVK